MNVDRAVEVIGDRDRRVAAERNRAVGGSADDGGRTDRAAIAAVANLKRARIHQRRAGVRAGSLQYLRATGAVLGEVQYSAAGGVAQDAAEGEIVGLKIRRQCRR